MVRKWGFGLCLWRLGPCWKCYFRKLVPCDDWEGRHGPAWAGVGRSLIRLAAGATLVTLTNSLTLTGHGTERTRPYWSAEPWLSEVSEVSEVSGAVSEQYRKSWYRTGYLDTQYRRYRTVSDSIPSGDTLARYRTVSDGIGRYPRYRTVSERKYGQNWRIHTCSTAAQALLGQVLGWHLVSGP